MPRRHTQAEVAERLWRLQNLYLIRDKRRRLVKLRFNPGQQMMAGVVERCLLGGRAIQHMDLKARQIGASTFWGIYYLDDAIFTPNTISYIVAQKHETLGLLWDVVNRAYRHMPEGVKPKTAADNAKTLEFGEIGSTVRVSLSVKSTTLHNLLVTEYALCDPDEIEQTLAACPPDANISLETVANGVNHAFDKWQDKTDGYTRIFHPWFRQPEYRLPSPLELTRTAEEDKFTAKALIDTGIKIDDEQIAFRRKKKRELKRTYAEKFAEDESSCFLASGNAFFSGAKVGVLMEEARAELEEMPPAVDDGEWIVFEQPQHRHIYVIGADVAEGIGQDSSSASVICVTCRKTAARYTARCGVDSFYRTLHRTGIRYNKALVAPELNNHGHAVVMGLREGGYPNLYRQEKKNRGAVRKKGSQEVVKIGWETTTDSKPIMMDNLKVALEGDSEADEQNFEPGILWLDIGFLKETLGIREEGGKIGAVTGKHDDITMGYAIAWQMYLRERSRIGYMSSGVHIGSKLESA